MKESTVKLLLLFTALISLVVGGLLLVVPASVASFVETPIQPGWLRSIGASVVGLQGLALFIVVFRRRDTNPLLGAVAVVTTLQAAAMWYSLFAAEYGEMNRWSIIVPAVLATVAALLMWSSWVSRRKSLSGLGGRSAAVDDSVDPRVLPGTADTEPTPSAELVEEIDAASPRFGSEQTDGT